MRALIIILLLSVCQGCLYYNYATRAKGNAILYEVRSPYKRGGNWQFYTALVDDEKVYVEFQHLHFTHFNKPGHKFHYMILEFRYKKNKSIHVLPGSISVVVRDINGKVVPQVSSSSWNLKRFSFEYPCVLPKEMIEEVQFSIESDGNVKNYEFKFPVKHKLHYTYFHVLMDV